VPADRRAAGRTEEDADAAGMKWEAAAPWQTGTEAGRYASGQAGRQTELSRRVSVPALTAAGTSRRADSARLCVPALTAAGAQEGMPTPLPRKGKRLLRSIRHELRGARPAPGPVGLTAIDLTAVDLTIPDATAVGLSAVDYFDSTAIDLTDVQFYFVIVFSKDAFI
jgi:hypothetical protein